MSKRKKCVACGKGYLTEKVGSNFIGYKWTEIKVERHYSTCDKCGAEQVNNKQSKLNKKVMLEVRKAIDAYDFKRQD